MTHPAPVRGDDERVPRGRPEARQLPLLLHPQAHVREGVRRVRAPARRLRHARRGVRDAHAHPDRQGPARADRAARRARRDVLEALAEVRARPSSQTGRYISPEDLKLVYVTDDVDDAVDELTGFYANYHSLRFVEGELVLRVHHAPDPDAARRAEPGVRRHRGAGRDRRRSARPRSSSATRTSPSSSASRSASTGAAGPAFACSSTR